MSKDRAQAFEAALNGVLGDYLAERHPGLAFELGLRLDGRPLPLTAEALQQAYPNGSKHLCLLVHGSSYDESCWAYPADPATNYGRLLEAEFGVTPLYLRYNSGLHISQNGRALAELLEQLYEVYSPGISELTLLGHSMGGLLIRSALYYGETLGHRWRGRAKRAIYLASPHLGSPHEKLGQVVTKVLHAIPDPVVQLAGKLAELRSAGVKDLRHGSLLDQDWSGGEEGRPNVLPLPTDLDHYLAAATLNEDQDHLLSRMLGDALVRVPSALGPGRQAGLQADHLAIFPGMHHMQIVHDPQVYQQLRAWWGATGAAPVQATAPTNPTSPAATPSWQRLAAYRGLVIDAVEHGVTAIQEVQEKLTQRPYDVLQQVPPLEAPVKVVRAVHYGVMRGSYRTIRMINRLTGDALAKVLGEPTKPE
ncbi:MAG: alpha/beta hydrolase [Deltaproteobacteria bacterium]|nr:alpha/beta hydrolase [Deltaproteobacteria bacterium]